jgi:hypothetical protein
MALTGALFMTAGCGSNLSTTPPLASQQVPSRQASALEYPHAGREWAAEDSYGLQARDSRRHPAPAAAKKEALNDRSGGLLSPGWAKEQQVEKEEWERQLERKINNICRGC